MATEVGRKRASTKASHKNEIAAIIIVALAVLLFLCLVSYSPNDPSVSTASSQKVQNWIGIVGANIAAFLINYVFGWAAYILPALLAVVAWQVFRSNRFWPRKSRIVGVLLFLISLPGLITLFGGYGATVGKIADGLESFLGRIGAGILLAALFLVSTILITKLSYASFFDNFRLAWDNFKIRWNDWRASIQGWQNSQSADAAARAEKRRETRGDKADKNPTLSKGESTALPTGDLYKKLDIADNGAGEPEPAYNPTISAGEKIADRALDDANAEIEISTVNESGKLDAALDNDPEESAPKPPTQNFDDYVLPTTDFLTPPPPRVEQKDEALLAVAKELAEKSSEFNVNGRVMHICQGPVVTTYEFKPDPGVKYSRITGLADDLCLALKAESIRIDRIPGKAYVGIEVPNPNRETIHLREIVESKKFIDSGSLLTIGLGKTIDGSNYVADLTKMPHLLIAGATGAGKSVGVNTLVVSILYKARPDEVKFIMVDPKRLELGLYADIPHLATPIITDPKRAAISMKWAVSEMERRYKELAGWGVRNIDGFNAEVKRRNGIEHFDDNGEPWKPLPYIVIIIDELADLMMVSGKEVEESITRLAQMARAVGIHLVLATQRPSVDVITGIIKANFPARISFRVSSKVDSRTIIDANGSERLLGKGDMLFLPPGTSQIVRVHGAYVDEKEINKIVNHVKAQGKPEYDTTITKTEEELDDSGDLPGRRDPLFMDALKSVVSAKRASTSLLQRHLRIGYGRAAAILDAMVREGLIGEMDGSSRARPILEKAYEFLEAVGDEESF